MDKLAKLLQRSIPVAALSLGPLNTTSLRDQAYAVLKNALGELDIYDPRQGVRLDERQLTAALGISRTPLREALSLLEQEGFIRTRPRLGIYIVRKSRREIVEMIQLWAALESMAARLATVHASDYDIAELRRLFAKRSGRFSDAHIAFHTAVIALGGSQTLIDATRNPIAHVRALWRAIVERTPVEQYGSADLVDHLDLIEALENRDTDLAERLAREHTLGIGRLFEAPCDILG